VLFKIKYLLITVNILNIHLPEAEQFPVFPFVIPLMNTDSRSFQCVDCSL